MARPTTTFVDQERQPGADALAQRVIHTDARTARERVPAGEFEGTPLAAELSQLMFLAGADEPFSHAAE